jgi:glycosyltransferase involved in cell wall biosynthesis
MRVLHVYSGNLFGGIEAILLSIARGRTCCPEVQHEFALCFEARLSHELKLTAARVHQLGSVRLRNPTSARAARAALSRLLESDTFDRVVCHAPWSQAIFGGVARRAGIPLAFWAHDVMTGRHWTERLARRVTPDLAICNSRFTAGTLQRLYPEVSSAVVYAPVAVPRAPITDEERRVTRSLLNTPETTTVIVQASRSEAWKGHASLIKAFADLRDVPDWIWWQVGGAQRPAEARFLDSLKQSARRLGVADRIRWIGERDDVPRLLAAADVYCQANLQPEPFGVVFVEALAAGLPVITTGFGGPCEIVDDSCGILVPPRDQPALAAALRSIVCDPARRSKLAQAAPARARQLCDPSTTLRRLRDVLAEMTSAAVHA